MKVKTFAVIVALLLLMAVLAVVYYAQDAGVHASPVTPAGETDGHYIPSTMPVLMPEASLPGVNESALNLTPAMLSGLNESTLNLTPVTLSENSNEIIEPVATPRPSAEPRSTPMAPMIPMEPWKPAAPMTH